MPREEEPIGFLMHGAFLEYEMRIAEIRLGHVFFDRLAFLEGLGPIKILPGVGDLLLDLRSDGVLSLIIGNISQCFFSRYVLPLIVPVVLVEDGDLVR